MNYLKWDGSLMLTWRIIVTKITKGKLSHLNLKDLATHWEGKNLNLVKLAYNYIFIFMYMF